MKETFTKISYNFIVAHVSRNLSLTSRNLMEKTYQKPRLKLTLSLSKFAVSKLILVFQIRFSETLKTNLLWFFWVGLLHVDSEDNGKVFLILSNEDSILIFCKYFCYIKECFYEFFTLHELIIIINRTFRVKLVTISYFKKLF